MRQLLKHCRLWYRVAADFKPVPNRTAPVGRALSNEELQCLVSIARTRPEWQTACTASILSAFCGLRACEIKALQWKHVDFIADTIDIRRRKTPGGWRKPTLNSICREALLRVYENASFIGGNEPEHYVFPWHGRNKRPDPTRSITTWRTAWNQY